ncbi:hypothetical protein Xenpb_01910 [Xenorhabdus sp. PB62.4]|nr:hypothetical protein [Xenorhabdus sp. PB62.4]
MAGENDILAVKLVSKNGLFVSKEALTQSLF